jgi:hypothetical protein
MEEGVAWCPGDCATITIIVHRRLLKRRLDLVMCSHQVIRPTRHTLKLAGLSVYYYFTAAFSP